MQADSKEMYDAWILALQKGIGAAIQRVNTNSIEMNDKLIPSKNGNLKSECESDERNKKVKKVRLVLLLFNH